MSATGKIIVSGAKLSQLVDACKRHIRQTGHSGKDGMGELIEALVAVVREISEAGLRDELERPVPAAVPREEEVAG